MKTNANLTLYNKYVANRAEKYQRAQIIAVQWENRKAANTLASGGELAANQATIYIPFQRGEKYLPYTEWQALTDKTGYWTLQEGDFVVRWLVSDEITNVFTIMALKAKYPFVFSIKSVDFMDMGSVALSHWKLGVK
jgi:hypothetical protein